MSFDQYIPVVLFFKISYFFMIRVIAECITCEFLIYSRSGFLLVNVICLQCMKDGGYFSLIEVIFSFILNYL